jgi:hypothetical protein
MTLVLGRKILEQEELTRTVTVDAKEPKERDKVQSHKLDIEVAVMDREAWDQMNDRWVELRAKADREKSDSEYEMSEEEQRELREPMHKIAKPYVRNIGPLADEDGNKLEFDDVKDALFRLTWLDQPIVDAFMAVQNGITVEEYRKRRAKNS